MNVSWSAIQNTSTNDTDHSSCMFVGKLCIGCSVVIWFCYFEAVVYLVDVAIIQEQLVVSVEVLKLSV